MREMKGLEMASRMRTKNEPDVSIRRLNKRTYKVHSQTDASSTWFSRSSMVGDVNVQTLLTGGASFQVSSYCASISIQSDSQNY